MFVVVVVVDVADAAAVGEGVVAWAYEEKPAAAAACEGDNGACSEEISVVR